MSREAGRVCAEGHAGPFAPPVRRDPRGCGGAGDGRIPSQCQGWHCETTVFRHNKTHAASIGTRRSAVSVAGRSAVNRTSAPNGSGRALARRLHGIGHRAESDLGPLARAVHPRGRRLAGAARTVVSSAAAWPATEDRENFLVFRGPHSVVVLNRIPYNNGHLLVAPRVHRGTLGELEGPGPDRADPGPATDDLDPRSDAPPAGL